MARPKGGAKIVIEDLEKLARLQCTQPEIAAYFGVRLNSVEAALRKPAMREAYERGQKSGLVSLRRAQFQAALRGNPTMLIWMGKQLLGQRDTVAATLEHTGRGGSPLAVEVKFVRPLLSVMPGRSDTAGEVG